MVFPEKIPHRDRHRVIELLNPSQPKFQTATEGGDRATTINEIFRKWRNSGDGTFHCMRQTLDQFSVFTTRNVLVSTCRVHVCTMPCVVTMRIVYSVAVYCLLSVLLHVFQYDKL